MELLTPEGRAVVEQALISDAHWAVKLIAIRMATGSIRDPFRAAAAVGISRSTCYRRLEELQVLLQAMRVAYSTKQGAHLRVVGTSPVCQTSQADTNHGDRASPVCQAETESTGCPQGQSLLGLSINQDDVVGDQYRGEKTRNAQPPDEGIRFIRSDPTRTGSFSGWLEYLRADWQQECDRAGKQVGFAQTHGKAVEGLTAIAATYDLELVRNVHRFTLQQALAEVIPESFYSRMFIGGGFNSRFAAHQKRKVVQTELQLASTPEEEKLMRMFSTEAAE